VVVAARGGLAGTSGPSGPVPATPDVVLTVKATNLAGQPDTGGVIQVFSVDSAPMARQSQQFAGGVAKFSIPAGTTSPWPASAGWPPAAMRRCGP
jgi:hypothetical protein